jgi:hypothetical protein
MTVIFYFIFSDKIIINRHAKFWCGIPFAKILGPSALYVKTEEYMEYGEVVFTWIN